MIGNIRSLKTSTPAFSNAGSKLPNYTLQPTSNETPEHYMNSSSYYNTSNSGIVNRKSSPEMKLSPTRDMRKILLKGKEIEKNNSYFYNYLERYSTHLSYQENSKFSEEGFTEQKDESEDLSAKFYTNNKIDNANSSLIKNHENLPFSDSNAQRDNLLTKTKSFPIDCKDDIIFQQ